MSAPGRILLVLACVLLGILGCRRENASQEASAKTIDKSELKIEEALKTISDWRFAHGDAARRKNTLSTFRDELYRLNDPMRRKNYVKKFAEIVFAYPLDAADPGQDGDGFYYPLDPNVPGTRKEQWLAFREMSDCVSHFAYRHCDMEYLWEVSLRRLKRIRDEMRIVETYLAGNGDRKSYKGERNGWAAYHKRVQGDYNNATNELSRLIDNILMTHTLSYDKWRDIHSRLEKIVGHEVEIRPSILKLWEEERKNEQKASVGVAATKGSPRGGVEAR